LVKYARFTDTQVGKKWLTSVLFWSTGSPGYEVWEEDSSLCLTGHVEQLVLAAVSLGPLDSVQGIAGDHLHRAMCHKELLRVRHSIVVDGTA
jgi:hypothetical protein